MQLFHVVGKYIDTEIIKMGIQNINTEKTLFCICGP
jgi:hypothetical protein